MKFPDVMIYFNYNMSNIARALDISRQYVSSWGKKNEIPYPYQCAIEKFTKGKLKAKKYD